MNMPASTLALEPADQIATLCKASGDPLRLNILRVLSSNSFGVLELAHIFATGQSGMSHHLKVLAQADLVATRREGNAVFYRRQLPHGGLHAALLDEIDSLPLDADLVERIESVHQQRAAASHDFFARIADKFQAHQDLIAGLPQYRGSVIALLDSLALADTATAVEIGPGDGGFLPELARRFSHVTAIDNSTHMLDQARARCEQEQLHNVELKLADALSDPATPADCVVVNMVLHHFAAPAEALRQLARHVQPGGSLLITELCSHNQSWARETCGDLWLGFEQDDLVRWAGAAGLQSGESLYIGLKNGFQIQIKHFSKPVLHSTSAFKEPT